MKTAKTFLIALLPLLMACMACSRQQTPLLETIPADVDYALTFNLTKFVESAGNEEDLSRYEKLLSGWIPEELADNAQEMLKAIDTDMIAGYGYGNNTIITFAIKDKSLLESLMSKAEHKSDKGFSIYRLSGQNLLVKGNQAWLSSSANPGEKISNDISNASDNPFSENGAIAEALDNGQILTVALSPKFIDKAMTDHWPILTLDISDNKLVAQMSGLNTEGENYTLSSLQPLSTDFLRYVPEPFNIACAFGATPAIAWDAIASMAGSIGGYRSMGLMETLLPYLKSIDGTVAFAAGTPDKTIPDDVRFIAMMHMPREVIAKAIGQIGGAMAQMRIPVKRTPDGISATIDGVTYTAAEVDGYLTLASIPISADHSNRFAPYFTGKNGAAFVSIPTLEPYFGSQAGFGMDMQLVIEPRKAEMQLSFPGSNRPIITDILSLIK